jgi:hypothetical protein
MGTDHSQQERPSRAGVLPLAALLVLSLGGNRAARASGQESAGGRLSYTRVLKGSTPEYIGVTVNADGTGTFDARKLSASPDPQSFKLSGQTLDKLYTLAAELNYFRSVDLESHKRVANLGRKTFTYEKDGQISSAEFNYTLNKQAQRLSDLFEKIAIVEQHIRALKYAIKYDPLGLPHELLLIQIDLENRALADPELMVPTLEEIARNHRFLHLAQVRARNILERVQSSN